MSLIRREEAFEVLTEYYHQRTDTQRDALREALERVPTIDAVEIIRCKDCTAFYDTDRTDWGLCRLNGQVRHDDFCSWAERKEEQ